MWNKSIQVCLFVERAKGHFNWFLILFLLCFVLVNYFLLFLYFNAFSDDYIAWQKIIHMQRIFEYVTQVFPFLWKRRMILISDSEWLLSVKSLRLHHHIWCPDRSKTSHSHDKWFFCLSSWRWMFMVTREIMAVWSRNKAFDCDSVCDLMNWSAPQQTKPHSADIYCY